jgi:hypothetical protein
MSGDDTQLSEPHSGNEWVAAAVRLDGNAAAGILSEILCPRHHDGERDLRHLRNDPAAGCAACLPSRHGYGAALSQLRRCRPARRAHTDAAVARSDRCEACRPSGRDGALGRLTERTRNMSTPTLAPSE